MNIIPNAPEEPKIRNHINCHACSAMVMDDHPAFRGMVANRINTLSAQEISLTESFARLKRSNAKDVGIQLLEMECQLEQIQEQLKWLRGIKL